MRVKRALCGIYRQTFKERDCESSACGPQGTKSHAKFRAKFSLPFPLLADVDKEVIKMYGVNGPLGLGVRRATLLIDGSRRIRDAVVADFRLGRHVDFVRKAILLRTGAAGPAPR